MAKLSISPSPPAFCPNLAELTCADNAISFDANHSSSPQVHASTPLSSTHNAGNLSLDVLSSKENAEFVTGDLSPGEKSHEFADIVVNPCPWKSMSDLMQETKDECVLVIGEVDSLLTAGNGKPKELSGSDVSEMEPTGFRVLGEASGKLSEKIDLRCSLKIELIDDTALIGLSATGVESATISRKNVKKELATASRKNVNKELKKEKKPRRRFRAAKKDSDENKNSSNLKVSTGNWTGYKRAEKAKKMLYSRKAMETLRFWNIKGQRKLWQNIYNAFSATMRTEYEELGCVSNQNNQSGFTSNSNAAPAVLGMAASRGGCLNHYVRGQDNLSGFVWRRRNIV